MMQTCVSCGETKPIGEFERQKNRPNPRKKCKACRHGERDADSERARHREYMRERRLRDPDAVRRNWEKSVYGATKEELGPQVCAVCGTTERICIDHEHSTGRVRGLLCGNCNTGLGYFRDDPELLRKAIQYLA